MEIENGDICYYFVIFEDFGVLCYFIEVLKGGEFVENVEKIWVLL